MSYSLQNVKPRMKYIYFSSQYEKNIIFIHKNIPYLLPSSALSQSVLGPPDLESLLVLFWSHFKSAIEHFYIKIKRGFRPCFHGGWRRETALSPAVKYVYLMAVPRRYFYCVFFFCFVFVMLSSVCLLMPCGHLLEKG